MSNCICIPLRNDQNAKQCFILISIITQICPAPLTFWFPFQLCLETFIVSIFLGQTNKEFNLRHDWNSLISDDESLRMTLYSKEFFPEADILVCSNLNSCIVTISTEGNMINIWLTSYIYLGFSINNTSHAQMIIDSLRCKLRWSKSYLCFRTQIYCNSSRSAWDNSNIFQVFCHCNHPQ